MLSERNTIYIAWYPKEIIHVCFFLENWLEYVSPISTTDVVIDRFYKEAFLATVA